MKKKRLALAAAGRAGRGTSFQYPLAGKQQWNAKTMGTELPSDPCGKFSARRSTRLSIRATERHSVAFAPDLRDAILFRN